MTPEAYLLFRNFLETMLERDMSDVEVLEAYDWLAEFVNYHKTAGHDDCTAAKRQDEYKMLDEESA